MTNHEWSKALEIVDRAILDSTQALKEMIESLHAFNHQAHETGVTPGTWWLIDGHWRCGECGYAAPPTNQVLIFREPVTPPLLAQEPFVSVVQQT